MTCTLTLWLTTYKGISGEARGAGAEGTVIDNRTIGAHTTSTRTWITTTLIEARLSGCTLGIGSTFWSTRGWSANEGWQTRTYSLLVDFAALRIWTTRRW